jgi:hypothetical protein
VRPVKKRCDNCGLTYFNDGHHAEVCHRPVFKDEPEYAREQRADDRDRTYEQLERPLTYPEKGLTE